MLIASGKVTVTVAVSPVPRTAGDAASVTTGRAATVTSNVSVAVAAVGVVLSVAVSVSLVVPAVVGVPPIVRVAASNVRPAGRFGAAAVPDGPVSTWVIVPLPPVAASRLPFRDEVSLPVVGTASFRAKTLSVWSGTVSGTKMFAWKVTVCADPEPGFPDRSTISEASTRAVTLLSPDCTAGWMSKA